MWIDMFSLWKIVGNLFYGQHSFNNILNVWRRTFTLSLSGEIKFDRQFPSRVTCSNAYLLRKTRTNLVISSKNRWIGKNKTLDTNVRRLTRVTKKSIELWQFHSFIIRVRSSVGLQMVDEENIAQKREYLVWTL